MVENEIHIVEGADHAFAYSNNIAKGKYSKNGLLNLCYDTIQMANRTSWYCI